MTKITRGRRMNAARLEYSQLADHTEIGQISRGQLVALALQLPLIPNGGQCLAQVVNT